MHVGVHRHDMDDDALLARGYLSLFAPCAWTPGTASPCRPPLTMQAEDSIALLA